MNFRENDAVAAFRQGDLERARSLTQEQLTAEPDAPQLQHLMGLILCRTGELERGIEWLRRATEAEPENIAYRVMLTRALADSGRAREALNIARAPTGTSPAELALWHARAEAATAAEAWEDSAEAWARLCAVSGDWRAWSNYGHALTALGRWAQASVAFKRALELNPGEVSLRRSLATVLARAGKYEESADELARWVDAVPENAEARLAFARLLADLGRHEEAMAQLHHAAELTTGAPAFLDSAEALIRIARPQNGVAVAENEFDLGILRELALLLERMSRLNLLSDLLNEAESHGIRREHMGYPAAAAALRGGDAAEARRLLLNVPAEND